MRCRLRLQSLQVEVLHDTECTARLGIFLGGWKPLTSQALDSPVAGVALLVAVTEVYSDFMDAVDVKNVKVLRAGSGIGARTADGVAEQNSEAQGFERRA